jgi:hypothetical protein
MTKISQLGAAAGLSGSEVIPLVQGGETKKATADQLFAFVEDEAERASLAADSAEADALSAANSATAAAASADDAAQSAAYAGGFETPEYASQSAGNDATTAGQIFRVPLGTTPQTFNWYRRLASGSELVDPLATSGVLAAVGGADLIGKAGGGTVQDFIDAGSVGGAIPDAAEYGELTPASTALATLEAAFSDLGAGGLLASTEEVNIGAAITDNPGVKIIGEQGIYFEGASGGRRLMNKPGRDASLHQWGRENLVRWLEGLRTGETLKVALVGDSNTETFVGTPLQSYLESLPNVSVFNGGEDGTTEEQWRAATGPYASNGKSMADVIAYDPDLIVFCFGTNSPAAGRTAGDFAATLHAAFTTIRASLGVNACSIALLTPNAMGDTSDRDELWSLRIRPIIRAMAERFDCGFFDKNALFPNSFIDLAAGAMQNKWLDSARVHTADLSTNILAVMIAEWLAPRELWARIWENIPAKAAADLPITYPPGMTIARMADAAINGFVLTINPISTGGHFGLQINWDASGPELRIAYRRSIVGIWSAWQFLGSDPAQTVGSIASGYNNTDLFSQALNTQRNGNLVSLDGRLNVSPAAQVLTSTTLANIATVSHRPLVNVLGGVLEVTNAGGSVELLRCDVTTAGNIVVRANSTMTDATSVAIHLVYRGAIV